MVVSFVRGHMARTRGAGAVLQTKKFGEAVDQSAVLALLFALCSTAATGRWSLVVS
jgi:hypothetical protein